MFFVKGSGCLELSRIAERHVAENGKEHVAAARIEVPDLQVTGAYPELEACCPAGGEVLADDLGCVPCFRPGRPPAWTSDRRRSRRALTVPRPAHLPRPWRAVCGV